MIPFSRPKLSDLYTLSQGKLLENHTLHIGKYLYSPYIAVPPPLRVSAARKMFPHWVEKTITHRLSLFPIVSRLGCQTNWLLRP